MPMVVDGIAGTVRNPSVDDAARSSALGKARAEGGLNAPLLDSSQRDAAASPAPPALATHSPAVSVGDLSLASAAQLQLSPAFHSPARVGTVRSAVFNLVSTILGGGMLSIPFAFARAGLVGGAVLLCAVALAAHQSVDALISCARRTGAASYADVAQLAFGPRGRALALALLVALTFLAMLGYFILAPQLLLPVLEAFVLRRSLGAVARRLARAGLCALALPACFSRTLSALQHLSLFSGAAIALLIAVVVTRAVQINAGAYGGTDDDAARADDDAAGDDARLPLWPRGFKQVSENGFPPLSERSLSDPRGFEQVAAAMPIFICTYVCHFNVLPVHCEITAPTRERLRRVVDLTIACTTAVYAIVGFFGVLYFEANGAVSADVLDESTFPRDDPLIAAGRVALAVVILCSLPLIVKPCCETVVALGADLRAPRADAMLASRVALDAPAPEDETEAAVAGAPPAADVPRGANVAVTLVVFSTGLGLSLFIDSVAVVWSLLGSTVSIVISFLIPFGAYLVFTRREAAAKRGKRALIAALLVFASATGVVCTVGLFLNGL